MRQELKWELKKSRVSHICNRVLDAYQEKFGLFSKEGIEKKIFPEKQLAKLIKNENDLALWFFFTCPGDKRINSIRYYEQLGKFYLKNTDFFRLNNPVFKPNITSFLRNVNIANRPEFSRTILENSKKLIENFEGNPLNIIKNNDYDTCVKNLTSFLGYGKEISSLYLVFLSRYGIKKTKNVAPKVDRHLLRISAGCGVFKVTKNLRISKATNEVSKLYTEVCKEKHIDGALLDALTYAIGNDLCSKKDDFLCMTNCPLDYYCNKQLPKINRKNTTLYIEKKEKTQQFLKFGQKNGLWSPDIPISYWPKNIREKFMDHAKVLYIDLQENKYKSVLTQESDGRKKREIETQNPEWYKNLIYSKIVDFKSRRENLKALERIMNGQDKEFKRRLNKNDSSFRDFIFERLTKGYETVYMGDLRYNSQPDEEVIEYFNLKKDINKEPEISENLIDIPF